MTASNAAKPLLVPAMMAVFLSGCAGLPAEPPEPSHAPRKEVFFAVTASHQLVSFNAGQPQKLLSSKPLTGLAAGEEVVGIDFRVAKGVLFALVKGPAGARVATLSTADGKVNAVGAAPIAAALEGREFGFDFNPTVDRIRVVSDSGQSLRLHPDTGALVQQDAKLAYVAGDAQAGTTPAVVAAAYTYNKQNDKITTNFVIDAAAGTLAVQGSREGAMPVVSPNTGQLTTVGKLNAGAFDRAAFDIADVSGAAFVALTAKDAKRSRFHLLDLATGATTFMGTIGGGEAVRGISFEP